VRRPLELRTGHRPFQLTVMVSGVISGSAGLAVPKARSNVIENSFPGWLLVGYYASLLLWCGLVLAMTIQPDRVIIKVDRLRTKMMLESAGLFGMGFTCAAYGVAALVYTGARALTATLFVGMFAAAALWRAVEIRVDLHKLAGALVEPHPADPSPLGEGDTP
jgi:hypothetical protein